MAEIKPGKQTEHKQKERARKRNISEIMGLIRDVEPVHFL
jgi:hypothetical protein